MKFEEQLDIYLRARFTFLVVITQEEERILQSLVGLCEKTQRTGLVWDVADGFQWLTTTTAQAPAGRDPISALEQIEKSDNNTNSIFVLKDFHDFWDNPPVRRKLRNLAQRLKYTRKTILVLTYSSKLPNELRDEAVLLEYQLPDADELKSILQTLTQAGRAKMRLTELGWEKMVEAALGLTESQAKRVYARALITNPVLDDRAIDLVTEEKKQIIRESEALEFYAVSETPEDVGGLGLLKEWLRLRERAFTAEARAYGLPTPKGITLLGIPGTGKSLTAKTIGGLWHQPLLRLDVGAIFGSLVGESEEKLRQALRLVETVAPCILWVDEIEKALAHGGLDSGTSTRVFGSFLTWMQEKTAPVFVVATANDISSLPPELLRKGRFDEIFFLDLPTEEERKEIFAVHLRKRRRIPVDYDLDALAAASEGYVGAELEQAVIEAMYIGFNDNQREFSTDDVLKSIKRLVPLSVSQRETISSLRLWLREGRAQSASFAEPEEAARRAVQIKEK
ncbi:MAG TPA: AAA family ATPase [Anaerolineaceae bacterium]